MWNAIRVWTRVTVSISYDDNHYTTGTSKIELLEIEPFDHLTVCKQLTDV